MGISFIGGGVMAEALIRGIIKADIAQPNEVIVSEPVSGRRDFLESEFGIRTVEQNGSILDAEGLIVLAVKPQTLPYVFPDLSVELYVLIILLLTINLTVLKFFSLAAFNTSLSSAIFSFVF